MKAILYFLSLFMFIHVKGQTKDAINPSDIVIEGEIIDSLLSLTPDKVVSVALYVSSFGTNYSFAPVKEYKVERRYMEKFRFVLPGSSKRVYVNIEFGTQDQFMYWSNFDNVYIFEPGDRIQCKLSNDIFTFSGKGAMRLQCQSAIYKIQYKSTKEDNKFANVGQWEKAIVLHNKKLDSIFQKRIAKVKEFEPQLGREMTNIMIANCYGLRYFGWLWREQLGISNYERHIALINSNAYKDIGTKFPQKLLQRTLAASPNYCDFLFLKLVHDNVYYVNGKVQSPKSVEHIRRMFNTIKNNYRGIIRDKLLTMFLIVYQQRPSILDYLNETRTINKNPEYEKILLNIKNTLSNGLPFYPFEFEDEKGHIVKLSHLNDKIVILDFWYTGCNGCIILNKAMKPIVAKYKNDSRIKFVSISIDKTKTGWLNSIDNGLYTHSNSINLYTGGRGADHPLFKHYGLLSYPTLYILKNGKMYAATPPKPLFDRALQKPIVEGNTEQLIELIEEALK